jgi:hypothetical protein
MADIASRLLDFPPQFRVTAEEFDKRIKAHLNLLGQISPAKLAVVDADQDLLEASHSLATAYTWETNFVLIDSQPVG